jgi:ectoine hydroxylase-related dioxygenase (phytanoyl-CoA dioxygenase family)
MTPTRQQLDTFVSQGVLHVKGLLSPDRVRRAREVVLRRLEQRGLWKAGAWRLDAAPRPKWPDRGLKASKVIGNKYAEIADLLDEPALCATVDALLGGRPFDRTVFKRPQVLFTLPNADTWTLPSTGWHSDSPRLPSGAFPGLQLFTFLDTVEPRGGGTLVIAGSHRLDNGRTTRPSELRRAFGREAFFHELFSEERTSECPALPSGSVGDIPLRVVELTGAPGDVWLLDLRILHCGAPNAAEKPRMMATYRYVRADLMRELAEVFGWSEMA